MRNTLGSPRKVIVEAHPLLDVLDAQVAELGVTWPESGDDKKRAAAQLGETVRQLREWRGWNHHKLAKRADVDMGLIIRLESGVKLPRIDRLRVIAAVLREGEFVPRPGTQQRHRADGER